MILHRLKESRMFALVLRGLALVVFHIRRYARDQRFLVLLGNPRFQPTLIGRIIAFALRVWTHLHALYAREYLDLALRRYASYNRRHYSPGGRGYATEAVIGDEEKKRLYGQPPGRISGFLDAHGDILGYRDGETFLDVGCGRGQNLKVLSDTFPAARLQGIDVNAAAVEVIRLAAGEGPVSAAVGDLTRSETFAEIADSSFDHVVMSHVFSVILGEGLASTRATRTMIVDEMVRIARKSVLIIDSPAIFAVAPSFEIEQRDRGVFYEDAAAYFDATKGRLLTLRNGESVGLLLQVSNGRAR